MFSGLIFVHHFIAIFGVRFNDPVCMYECGLVQCVYMHVYVCVCVFVYVCVCVFVLQRFHSWYVCNLPKQQKSVDDWIFIFRVVTPV